MKTLSIIAAGMFAMTTAFAQNGEKAKDVHQDKKEIQKDKQDIQKDKKERNVAVKAGHPKEAVKKEIEVKSDKKEMRQDKIELNRDVKKN